MSAKSSTKKPVKSVKVAKGEGKRKRRRKETYSVYIYKVLKQGLLLKPFLLI